MSGADKGFADLPELLEAIGGDSRRERQKAAHQISVLSKSQPQELASYAGEFVEALSCPEAQTRWELLDVLTLLIPFESRTCEKALPEAEGALFDETSGTLRVSAMKFLCRLGATTENRSEKIWPLVDEAIQCYHGDLEFQDMLNAVVEFSEGKLSEKVKLQLGARMSFDASNGRGLLKRRAEQILANVSA